MSDRVAIITDSSACVPPAIAGMDAVSVVPVLVHVDGEDFRAGVDLDPELLYAAMRDGRPVKSSAPSPIDYLDAIEAVGADAAVVVTPADEFTRMRRNAELARDLTGRPVVVVDSRSAAAGQGLVVLAGVDTLAVGGGVDDVVAAVEDAARRVDLVASLESLSYLRSSGRVPATALGLADHLGVRPVFRMRDGVAERVGLARSEQGALARVARAWREGAGGPGQPFAVFHAGRPDRAARLVDALRVEPAFITEFSPALTMHTGPGVAGVAWLRPPATDDVVPRGRAGSSSR